MLDDRVIIPPPGTVSPSSIEWDGTPGRTSDGGIKSVRTTSGKTIEADFVFVSIGNKPNSGLVKDVDAGAVKGGMIWVDEYLRVSGALHLVHAASVLHQGQHACATPKVPLTL